MDRYRSFAGKYLRDPTDNGWIQLFRYGFVGGTAFLVDFGLLAAFTELAGFNYLVSAALSFIAGLTINYLLSVTWVFASRKLSSRQAEFTLFTVIGVVGLGFNELFMWIFTDGLGWHYLVSKIVTTAVVFLWNFLARRFLLFHTSVQPHISSRGLDKSTGHGTERE